jgi:hypothetical protein
MKENESQGVDNGLDKDKSTRLKNQDKMTTHNVVANRDERFETSNGYGVNMNLVAKVTKVIMNSKLEVKLGQLIKICPQLKEMVEKSLIKMKRD